MKHTKLIPSLVAALAMASCGGGGGNGGDDDADATSDADADPGEADADAVEADGPDAAEDGAADPDTVEAPPFDFVNAFTVDVDGSGSVRMGDVLLAAGSGSLDMGAYGGIVPALAYEMTDWAEYGYTLFHLVAPEADTLNVSYLYCTTSGLAWIWHEDYSLPMDVEMASGTCEFASTSTPVPDPGLLDLAARPSAGQLVTGFAIDGAEISFSAGPGTIAVDGSDYDLYPFEVVDCTTTCSADPADGWWELHSLLVGADGRQCFGIIYLMVANPAGAFLGYPVCFDPVERLTGPSYAADWTAPPSGGSGGPPPAPAGWASPFLPWPRPPEIALLPRI